jgi:hypothetical protein
MYTIHSYCPRCGGYRLLKQSTEGVLVICSGCGLTTAEPELPPPLVANPQLHWHAILYDKLERFRLSPL